MTQLWLRASDYSSNEAQVQALKYAEYVGSLPQFLRKHVRVAQILGGDYPAGGSPGGFALFHSGRDYSILGGQNGGDVFEELTVHEATHIIDPCKPYTFRLGMCNGAAE